MPSCATRGMMFWWTKSALTLLAAVNGLKIGGASIGFLSSNKRPYGLVVQPAAAVHQLSSAVMNVPHGVQYDGSNETLPPSVRLCQIVSVAPERRSWRCTPDCPVSKTVKMYRPLFAPVSLTVFMSKLPVFGTPAASCTLRLTIDRCWKSGLPKVIGWLSSAV